MPKFPANQVKLATVTATAPNTTLRVCLSIEVMAPLQVTQVQPLASGVYACLVYMAK